MDRILFSYVILCFVVFVATLKSSPNENLSPDVNITGTIQNSTFRIYCKEIGTSLNIEFIAHGKTVCHINRSLKQCGSCKCVFISTAIVMIESNRLPQKNEVFGCQMIFQEDRQNVKVYSSVKYNGRGFIKQRKQVQPIAAKLDDVIRPSSNDNTDNQDSFFSYNAVIWIVVISSVLFSLTFAMVFYLKQIKGLYRTVSTRDLR